jgi:hypothetical protein
VLVALILGLTGGKFSQGGWSLNEADSLDVVVLSLACQEVSSLILAGAGMRLIVLMCLCHPWLDRE